MADNTSAASGIGSLLSPVGLIGTGIGLLGSIGKMFGRGRANRELEAMLAKMPKYKNQAGLAQTLLNARMPGAAQAERNIYQQEANQIANAQRAATSGNQLLLAGAGATGMANQAFGGINQAELADYQRRYGNLVDAQQQDYQAAMQRYGLESQLRGAQQENRQNTMGDISGLGFGFANLAAQGAFTRNPNTQDNPVVQQPMTSQTLNNIPSTLLNMGYGSQNRLTNIPRNLLNTPSTNIYGNINQ
mgnify:CR=1 FL=1